MQKFGYIVSVVTALFLGSASAADYEFTPLVGVDWPEGNLGLQSGQFMVGGEFQFNNLFEIIKPEVAVYVSPDTDYLHSSEQTTISRFILNGVHEYTAINTVVPFVKAGLGYENMTNKLYGNEDSIMADVGAGGKLPLTSFMALKLEAVYMLKYNSDRWDNNLAGLAGLTFSFGGSEPVAAAAVTQDSDGDGVLDENDACPDTPAGVRVDARGCTLDSDHDGVPDSMDDCPDTPSGEAVDSHGCLLDSDHDGVPDMSDKCPNTPEGAVVDELGCPVDSDADGVVDLNDNCPNTPKGFKVDNVGCPIVKTLKLNFETGSSKIAADFQSYGGRIRPLYERKPGIQGQDFRLYRQYRFRAEQSEAFTGTCRQCQSYARR